MNSIRLFPRGVKRPRPALAPAEIALSSVYLLVAGMKLIRICSYRAV